jgi:hypothetical protein
MFLITQHPSSGSDVQYLAKIADIGSIVQVTSVVSIMATYVAIKLTTPVT